jgi:hypothetical protein
MFTVYTATRAIHSVPKDGLDKIGPETLKAITGISEEVPWGEKKLKEFKKKREKQIEEEENAFYNNAKDTSVESWTAKEGDTRMFRVRFGDRFPFTYDMNVLMLNSIRNGVEEISAIREVDGHLGVSWLGPKVALFKQEMIRKRDAERKETLRNELNCKIAELQKQLRELE